MTKDEMLEAIQQMNVMELSDLVKVLEEEFGITAAGPVAPAAASGAAGAQAVAAPAQDPGGVAVRTGYEVGGDGWVRQSLRCGLPATRDLDRQVRRSLNRRRARYVAVRRQAEIRR